MIEIGYSGVKNKPYRVVTGGYVELSNGDRMYIPKDFIFDNASIPKILKWVYDLTGWELWNYKCKSFLIHDYMYAFRGYRTSRRFAHKHITRAFADKEMIYQMINRGHSEFKTTIYFLAVRLFGWWSYGRI
jgi:hypothetical protein